ncbi:hypothetical protein VNO77_04523 [Canavalia gladiata]|uniref:Uncharacterized protein n=1 Tax=Canavalia gladiata TaxID=3824 RepID=A0AAN9MXB6_CANGL
MCADMNEEAEAEEHDNGEVLMWEKELISPFASRKYASAIPADFVGDVMIHGQRHITLTHCGGMIATCRILFKSREGTLVRDGSIFVNL